MAVTDARPTMNRRQRYSLMANAANPKFAVGAVVVPLVLPIVAYLSGDMRAMFTVHLFLGAFWFGTAILGAVVLGPVMGGLSGSAGTEFSARFVPKMTFLMEATSLGVIGSGIGLADMMGLWNNPSLALWTALVLAGALLVLGFGPLHRMTVGMFDELTAEKPQFERLDRLNRQYGLLSVVELVLMIAIVTAMSGLRWGF